VQNTTDHLRTLARHLAHSYRTFTQPRAILLVGSAATGDADAYSDLDLILYYDELPQQQALTAARQQLGAERFRISGQDEDGYGERFYLSGVECQVAHLTVRRVEEGIAKLVVDLDLSDVRLKVMSGLFEGVAIHGEELIERWRTQARYGDELQREMIRKHWRFFPWWYFQERLTTRDATAWRHDVLVQSTYNIVGVLAALNRLFFSTLEFKRMSKFTSRLTIAPPNLGDRLEALFSSDERTSTAELEQLVRETKALIADRFPDLDLSIEWGGIPTPPGSREPPWA